MTSPAHMDIAEPYPAPVGYSVMDSNFGLKSRPANMNDQLNYVTHGYVENQGKLKKMWISKIRTWGLFITFFSF